MRGCMSASCMHAGGYECLTGGCGVLLQETKVKDATSAALPGIRELQVLEERTESQVREQLPVLTHC